MHPNDLRVSSIAKASRLERPVRILIVSHWFPPTNVIGAVRVGKFAKFLHQSGYEVKVIAATDASSDYGDHSLPIEIPSSAIEYVESYIDQAFRKKSHQLGLPKNSIGQRGVHSKGAPETRSRSKLREILTRHYYAMLRIPDARAGWINSAIKAGADLVGRWKPDIIFASAPPNSSLVAAARIAHMCGCPWIAELRDLWTQNPYYEYPAWRLLLDQFLEHRTLRTAAGLVSVTPLWTESLKRRYRQPAICVLNGFVPEDFPTPRPAPPPSDVVSLLYTGNVYAGFRDPSPLFEAIGLLGSQRRKIAVHFYGPPSGQVYQIPAAHDVADCIFVHDRVTYKESLALQCSADVLLLLQWANKKDEGNIPAKFFEYLGAGRPMLMLGYQTGTLAKMMQERGAGLASNSPVRIAEQLREWIAQRPYGIKALGSNSSEGMTRDEQFRSLEGFIKDIIEAGLQKGAIGSKIGLASSATITGGYG